MKHLKQLSLCLLLAVALSTAAMAASVPETLTVENLNGQQRMVKTYTLSPDADPETLREADFEYDGFRYSWAYTLKEEHPYLDTKTMTQTVTVETPKNDLSLILAELAPALPYDDGEYTGELTLEHTTLDTQAAGYTTRYSTVTETKVIGSLDRNDMSYVPATTVKNGKTLSLANVEWQVTGTALVGEALVPSQYQAVATYSATGNYKAATGYVTTAEYRGKVTSEGIESVTYTVVYTGTALAPAEPEPSGLSALWAEHPGYMVLLNVGIVLLLAALAAVFFLRRENVCLYVPTGTEKDYKLIGRRAITKENLTIDIRDLDPYPSGILAVEIKRRAIRKLAAETVTVLCKGGEHTYSITTARRDDWHEFELPAEGAEKGEVAE